jgi:hypothetical protein
VHKSFWKLLIVLTILGCDISVVNASVYPVPEIGKRCPDFKLDNLVNSRQKQISLKDFKGKWLIIDFWEAACAVCIKRFPEVNRLQQIFHNDLSVVMIGYNELHYNRGIKKLYLQLQDRMHLQLLAAFDSVLFRRWQVNSVPHIILVNPSGQVYAITNGLDMDSAKVRELLDGKNPKFMGITFKWDFDRKRPLLINNNGGPDTGYLYRSLLTHYMGEEFDGIPIDLSVYYEENKAGFQLIEVPLSKLYQFAYIGTWYYGLYQDSLFGKFSSNLELDIKDSSLFRPDVKRGENYFNYSLFVPPGKANPVYLMQVMQRELKNCFGYDAQLEGREVPYWRLVLRHDTLVSFRSKGSVKQDSSSPMEIRIKNGSVDELLLDIASFHQDKLPFIDETGINYKIDIQFNALLTDLSDVQLGLRKNGLELIKGKKWMKVIVIRDPAQK